MDSNSRQFESLARLGSMRQSRRSVLGVVLGAALLAQVNPNRDDDAWVTTTDAEVQTLLALINDYRASKGLSTLAVQEQLVVAAEIHSLDQATNNIPGHLGSDGSWDHQRVLAQGYSYAAEAENAAWSSNNGTALDAFTRWKASAGHDANMLGPYTDVGLALGGSKFGYFWTAVFARPADW